MFWWKSRTNTQNWIVYHPKKTTSVPGQPGLYLNSSLAGFTTGGNWITELSSTRIAITDGQVSSGSNRDDVVYSFKSVEGFLKSDLTLAMEVQMERLSILALDLLLFIRKNL